MSIISRIIASPRPLWRTILISLSLLLVPFGAALADGTLDEFLRAGAWRLFLMAPVVIGYILIVSHWLAKSDSNLLEAFRPLVLIDDEAFDRLRRQAARLPPAGEICTLLLGALIGLGISLPWLKSMSTFWLRLYVPVSLILMWSMLALVIYYSIASTRLVNALHRQPLKVDILDTRPFEPMGRYSLIISLVFIGGIALGFLFSLDVKNIFAWQTWAVNLPLVCVPVIIFFLNMRPTHRLLAVEKKRQLQAVRGRLLRISQLLQKRIDSTSNEGLGQAAGEFTALVAYEARLRVVPTWPYNTAMLRTLSLTIFVPLVVRGLSLLLFGE